MYQSLLLVLNILCFFGNIYEFNGFMKKRFENCWDWRTFPPPASNWLRKKNMNAIIANYFF